MPSRGVLLYTLTIPRTTSGRSCHRVKVEGLRRSLDRVYDIGAIDLVDFKLVDEDGHSDLVIEPRERATGRIHVRTGLKLFSDLDADSDFNFLTSHFGSKLGPNLPFYENFRLGGFLNLSGYPFEGLADQYSGLARLMCYRRVLRLNKRPIEAIYVGGSAETGRAWHRFSGGLP